MSANVKVGDRIKINGYVGVYGVEAVVIANGSGTGSLYTRCKVEDPNSEYYGCIWLLLPEEFLIVDLPPLNPWLEKYELD